MEVTDITVAPKPDIVKPMSLQSLSHDAEQEAPVEIPPADQIQVVCAHTLYIANFILPYQHSEFSVIIPDFVLCQ